MFSHTHYVPILKGKLGEFGALRTLRPDIKEKMTPVVEILEAPGKKPLNDHISHAARQLESAWGKDRHLFLDCSALESEAPIDSVHCLGHLLEATRRLGMRCIPVVSPGQSHEFVEAVASAVRADGLGFCIRLTGSHLADPSTLAESMEQLVHRVGSEKEDVDVILDLGDVSQGSVQPHILAARAIIHTFPYVRLWRTLTLASGGFPINLAGFEPDSLHEIPRSDWQIWRCVVSGMKKSPRLPTFGDYAIANPVMTEFDFRTMRMSANLRYTTADSWLVAKGKNTKDYGYDQFADLCSIVMQTEHFSGSDFSAGDEHIERCSRHLTGPGNATTWRQIGTSHHLTCAALQVASWGAP